MKHLALAFVIAVSIGNGSTVHAQESLIGKYTGTFTYTGGSSGPRQLGLELDVATEDNGVVKGVVRLTTAGPCAGTYPMAGKLQDNKLIMRSTAKSGAAGDCSFSFNAVREGNKLVGTTGTRGDGRPLQLSK